MILWIPMQNWWMLPKRTIIILSVLLRRFWKKVSTIEERGEFPIKFLNGYYGIVRNFEKRLIEGTRSSFRNEFCGAKTYFLNHDGKFLFEIEGVFHVKENPGVVTNIHESYMKGIMKDYDVK